jgi:LPXTG-site transpeptidase (sortase) family protein
MKKKIYQKFSYIAIAIVVVFSVVTAVQAATGYVDPTDKWAWGTNIGWINFNPTHGGVTVYDDHLEGYAWSENAGWIRLGTYEGGGAHTYTNDAADTYGVNNDGAGNLSGYAWGTNIGWVNFNPTHGGVTIDADTGEFDGYAWAENVGWISFNGSTYQVVASSTLMVLDSGVLANEQNVSDGSVVYGNISQFTVEFAHDVYDPAGDTDPDDVTNPDNYLLFQAGEDGVFDTVSCDVVPGVDPNDIEIPVGPVEYSNSSGTYTAVVTVNSGKRLPKGEYRLLVCGSTSIVDLNGVALAGDGVTSGTDWAISFTVAAETSLPKTGFAKGSISDLSEQPDSTFYAETDLTLEIPALDVKAAVDGVPLTAEGWDVSWLGTHVGFLEGSAFPTLNGNTVLTGHVWDANNAPGVFADLKSLKYGDQIMIHVSGKTYVYEVRERKLVNPGNVGAMMQPEEYDWVTLITCEGYNPLNGKYLFRRMVRAVLVDVR